MKRFLDFLIGLLGLIILSPVFLALSLYILIKDGRPIFFTQERVGKNNEIFKIYKFRTMKKGTGDFATGEIENPDEKIINSGAFMRMSSLDELPQLINLVNGTMSLVGPRPLIPQEKEIRELREKYGVYSVLPGITGWAQVNGRDLIDYEQKALYDKEYVEKKSLGFDIKILFLTVKAVIKHEGFSDNQKIERK